MNFDMIFALFFAIGAAKKQIQMLEAGETDTIDVPDVAFKIGKVRYDILTIEVKRAE